MAGKSTSTHTVEVGSITLHELYGSLQDSLRQTMERSLDVGNQSLAERLDDVLIRQRFWEYDIHLKDGALSELEASDTVASSIIRRYLDEIERSLVEMNAVWDDETNNKKMSFISKINTFMCGKVEIFDAIAAIGAVDAPEKDRKSTAIGQLRRQLELENQKLHSQSRKKPQGTLRLLYSPEKIQRQAILDIVAVHSFNLEHKAAEQHALDTWRKPAGDNGRFWLRDDLPGAIPQARIFLYEYDSIHAFEKQEHFISTSNGLLESIRCVRQENPLSPLLFIAHALGGLLVLQALVSASRNPIYDIINNSTIGIAFFDDIYEGFNSASGSQEAAVETTSELRIPKDGLDTMHDTSLFDEILNTSLRPDFHTVFFISMAMWQSRFNFPFGFWVRETFKLDATPNEVCRFDGSGHDQANLDIVISEIAKLYRKAQFKVSLSQVTRNLNLSEAEVSSGEDIGSSSSAQTHGLKVADSKKPSGHDIGSSPSAKTQHRKASVSEIQSDEGLIIGYSSSDESA